jgi:hypothetical protein
LLTELFARCQADGLRRLLMGRAIQRTMDAEVRTLDDLKRVLEA